jgi:phosphate transport system permease protein
LKTGAFAPQRPSSLARKRGGLRRFGEGAVKTFCLLSALVSVLTTFGIIFTLFRDSIPFFQQVPISELFKTKWGPESNQFGILPLLNGTFIIAIGAGLIAIPLGLLIGVYLSEYASSRVRNILKPALELLAGIPTVVYGFFALFVITPFLKQFMPSLGTFNALSGCIVVGIMILPLVASLCEDAISAVPEAMREAAYGLGSRKHEVTLKIVIPAALSGVIASFILALSRAVGETMAVTLAAGANPRMTLDLRESIQTMTAYIVQVAKGDSPAGTLQYYTLYAVGLVLFLITLGMNLLATYLVRRYRQAY